jgi:galactose mutarotase-like enzyme
MTWDRNWGCRAEIGGTLRGWDSAVIQNDKLRVTILPGKGCDVVEALYKPMDLDFAPRTTRGLRSRDQVIAGPWSETGAFLDQYEGGWQEILPSGGAPGSYAGANFPQHGESSRATYSVVAVEDSEAHVEIRCTTRLAIMPLVVTKTFELNSSEPTLKMTSTLTNETSRPLPVMWGQHLAFGAPFIGPGAFVELPAGTTYVADHREVDATRRRSNGQAGLWPDIFDRDGGASKMDVLPPRGTASDLHYLEPPEGWYRLTSSDRSIGVRVQWDLTTQPYLWLWQEYGATTGYPWWASEYLIGLEPWTSTPGSGLAEAVATETALYLEPGASRSTSLSVEIEEGTKSE